MGKYQTEYFIRLNNKVAHSLKSASGLLNFKRLHIKANKIEYLAKYLEENGEESAQTLPPTIDTLNHAFFKRYMKRLGSINRLRQS